MRRLPRPVWPAIPLVLVAVAAGAQAPTTLDDFFLPGSQPGDSGQLEQPSKCDNCHGGYDAAVEPAFNWRGSMMAQAARDPLFYACLAIANQDAPDSGDLCIRCHSPSGWLEGRSLPTDGSALNNNDREGVQCDFCHKLVDPLAAAQNPFPGDPDYTTDTFPLDQAYLASLTAVPPASGNGMYVADVSNAKRGPFVDAAARHQMLYSPFHQQARLCGTCHDVSNPVYERQPDGTYLPGTFGEAAADFDPYTMFPIERTFSEWLESDYAVEGGPFAATCQDCHMRDVTGVACNKNGAVLRDDLPLHDLTGGNTFIPTIIDAVFPGETDPAALAAGVARATAMLQSAATLELTVSGGVATVRVTNETGHKLPSGYPEGRRMWIHLVALDDEGATLYESGAYDAATGDLTEDADAKVYEIKLGISADVAPVLGRPAGESFHFVLNNQVYKDNRIPPRGFTNAAFEQIQSPPVGYAYADGQYADETDYPLPAGTVAVTATLYYQTLSKEYVTFLRDENVTNDWGQVLYDLWDANGKSAPVAMATATWGEMPEPPGDTEPPTAPAALAATALSASEVGLTWTASTDNVGVTGYRVYRDGAAVAETAGTSQTDTGLKKSTTYAYFVTALDAAGNESAASETVEVTTQGRGGGGNGGGPKRLELLVAGANPFNPETELSFALPAAGPVRIDVHDVTGHRVATLEEGWRPAGTHTLRWRATDLASGVYVVRLTTDRGMVTRKVTVLK